MLAISSAFDFPCLLRLRRMLFAASGQRPVVVRAVGFRKDLFGLLHQIGAFIGNLMVEGIMSTADPETYRLPVLISYQSYVFSFLVAVAAAVISALLVRRKLAKLDLIEVLKTRD